MFFFFISTCQKLVLSRSSALSLFFPLSLFFSITFLYAFSSSYRISFLHLLAQKLFRTPFSFEASVVVSSLLDSCWSSRRNVFLFDARVLACYARLVNLFSVLNSSRWSMLVPIPIPFPCVFCQRLEFETLTIGQNWRGEKKREKKIRLVGRWNLGYFFSTRERRERRVKQRMRMERARPKSRWTFHAEIHAANAESFTRPRWKKKTETKRGSIQFCSIKSEK